MWPNSLQMVASKMRSLFGKRLEQLVVKAALFMKDPTPVSYARLVLPYSEVVGQIKQESFVRISPPSLVFSTPSHHEYSLVQGSMRMVSWSSIAVGAASTRKHSVLRKLVVGSKVVRQLSLQVALASSASEQLTQPITRMGISTSTPYPSLGATTWL